MTKTIILGICLVIFAVFGFAQQITNNASKEFDVYEKNFGTPTPKPTRTGVKPTQIKTPIRLQNLSVGKPGMKIWLEKQINCRGAFVLVAPGAVFRGVDCIRLRFRLNFDGYLKIINRGTSGNSREIFPLDDQSDFIRAKVNNYLPNNDGWKFVGEPGEEQLFFIVSKSPLNDESGDSLVGGKGFGDEYSGNIEVYDKDIAPRTEKNEVYVLSDDTRLEKPIVFRLTIKHR